MPDDLSRITAEISWWRKTDRMTEFHEGISSPIYINLATGEELSSRELPYGACYVIERPQDDLNAYPPVGADGLSIACVVPNNRYQGKRSHWYIDCRCSNCSKPDDSVHRCWVRHGTVGDRLTIDKSGNTCSAGGGSIVVEGWHGFLRDGRLVPC